MRLLLDSNAFVWAVADSPKLTRRARKIMQDANEIYVSAASLWELSIKRGLGKFEGDPRFLHSLIAASGFRELSIVAKHTLAIADLPAIHKDPFDRLLIAQALTEPMQLLTADALLGNYTDLVTVF
jgi:PIN domain nuclease of toxin-antitoxin system